MILVWVKARFAALTPPGCRSVLFGVAGVGLFAGVGVFGVFEGVGGVDGVEPIKVGAGVFSSVIFHFGASFNSFQARSKTKFLPVWSLYMVLA